MHECVPVCVCVCVQVVQGILSVCLKYYKSCYKYRQLCYFLHLPLTPLPPRINTKVRKSLHYTQISHVTCYSGRAEKTQEGGGCEKSSLWRLLTISLCLFECSFCIQNIFLHLFMHFLFFVLGFTAVSSSSSRFGCFLKFCMCVVLPVSVCCCFP